MNHENNPNFGSIEKPYKSKFVCTDCRKTFKRRLLSDISKEQEVSKPPKCPECGKTTFWIGPKFRSPKTEDIKSWNSVKILCRLEIISFSGWATIPINIPKSEKELKELLVKIKNTLQLSLKTLGTSKNEKVVISFAGKIKVIEKYLNKK